MPSPSLDPASSLATPAGSAFLDSLMRIMSGPPGSDRARGQSELRHHHQERESLRAETQDLVAHMRRLAREMGGAVSLADR
jgi:hypothetical protein